MSGELVGEIINVCADESVLTGGKIDPEKLRPIHLRSRKQRLSGARREGQQRFLRRTEAAVMNDSA